MRYEEVRDVEAAPQSELEEALRRKVAELESRLETMTTALVTTSETLSKTASVLAAVTAERDKLRRAYELLKGQLELLRRRIFVAKAERIDTTQLEIEFAETKAKLDKLAQALDANGTASPAISPTSSASCPIGRETGISSSHRSTGLGLGLASTKPSSSWPSGT